MAEAVYVLCAAASTACAVLLLRGWQTTRSRLIFWSCLCFAGLALNNVLLAVDLVAAPGIDLSLLRNLLALGSLGLLLFGLVWESR